MTALDLKPAEIVQSIAGRKVLVVGDVMLDRYLRGDVSRISPEAPVPILQVMQEDNRLGGAANVAMNIKSLGGQVLLQSVMGVDSAADELLSLCEMAHIPTRFVRHASLRTTLKLRLVARSQQMLRADFEDRPGTQALADLWRQYSADLEDCHVVLFSDYAKGALADVARMIELAKSKGLTVLVDPKGDDFSKYRGADIITPNRSELMRIIGPCHDEEQLRVKVKELCASLNIRSLVLTRADEGMTLFEQDRFLHIPAQQVEIADVTGAGDTVIAVLSILVASGVPLEQAMLLANRAGGLVVSKFGTATLTAAELFGT